MRAGLRRAIRTVTPAAAAVLLLSCGGDSATEPEDPAAPAAVRIVSGHEQQGVVGRELPQPVVVEVVDGKGKPVANQHVNFRVVTGGGSVFAGAAVTNRQGVAQERWTLGTVAWSPQRLEARAVDNETGAPLTFAAFEATAVPDEAVSLAKAGGDQQAGALGTPLPDSLAVRAVDQYGNGVRGVAVTWSLAFGGGELSATSATTDSLGFARVAWTIGTRLDAPLVVTASAGELGTLTFSATAGLPATASVAAFAGSGQQVEIGTVAPQALAARVTLADGRPVSGIAVAWAVTDGGGTVTPPTSITDATGTAVAQLTTGTTAGPNTVTATVAGLAPVTFTVQALPGPPARVTLVSGDGLRAAAGEQTPIPPSVQVLDRADNPVPNIPVAWAVTSGGGSVTPASPSTDASGLAGAVWTLGPAVGAQTITATVQGLPPVTFSATAGSGAPATLEAVSGDQQTGVAGSMLAAPVVVRVLDRFGNPVGVQRVTFTPAPGSGSTSIPYGSTNAAGEISVQWQLGAQAGPQSLTAAVANVPPLGLTATAVAGAPASIAIVGGDRQVGTAGQPLAAPLTVRVTDAHGNPAASTQVTWSVNGACGSVAPSSAVTNAVGVVSAAWTLGLSAEQCRQAGEGVTARIGTGASVLFSATIIGAAPTVVTARGYDVLIGTAGTAMTLAVYAEDAQRNPVLGAVVTFAIMSGGGSLASTMATTDATGRATVSFTPGTVAGDNEVTASAAGASNAQIRVWTKAAAPVRLVAVRGDGQTGPLGRALADSLVVRVEDRFGNGVYDETVAFAAAAGSGSTDRLTLTTDTLGYAATGWHPERVGANTASATWGGQSLTFGATGTTHGGLGILIVSGNEQSAPANAYSLIGGPSAPLVVRVIDGTGAPVAGVTVTWTGDFVLRPATGVTDAAGLAEGWPGLDVYSPGDRTIEAKLPDGTSVPFTFHVTGWGGGMISAVFKSGDGQAGRVGTRLPVPLTVECYGRTGPAPGRCGLSAPGGMLPVPGYRPAHVLSYYWVLPTTPGTYSANATAYGTPGSISVTATAVP